MYKERVNNIVSSWKTGPNYSNIKLSLNIFENSFVPTESFNFESLL